MSGSNSLIRKSKSPDVLANHSLQTRSSQNDETFHRISWSSGFVATCSYKIKNFMLTRIPARHICGLDGGPNLKPIPLRPPIVGWVWGPASYPNPIMPAIYGGRWGPAPDTNPKTPAICGVGWGPAPNTNPITPAFVGWIGGPASHTNPDTPAFTGWIASL